ncbi:OsmC family protein [Nocardioides halotolerans]|uniref:OsmC family protein n=1 Tax=Nocardioides halotolerans TaxID=433660 RepID=UPI00040DF1B1|nr:OsmC family protein [Nocardioides halotolerans]
MASPETGADFAVRLTAGSLRHDEPAFVLPHAWTDAGVSVEGGGTGAHVFHAAVALCVLNDVFREARADGLVVDGVAVEARGGFDVDWSSTGVSYAVRVDSAEDEALVARVLARVDDLAEIPRAVRRGAPVERTDG